MSAGAWLPVVAGLTIVLASITALRADNLKCRLAWSTVSQLSYVVLAVALLTPRSVMAAVLHIAAHAVAKITLFFAAGAIYTVARKTEVSELAGIGRRMPLTMAAFAIGALSMVGVPPTAGFLSKWYLLGGAMSAGQYAAVAVIAVSTVLNAAYFLPIVYLAFFRAPADDGRFVHGEAPAPMLLALVFTATATVALFFWPGLLLRLAADLAGG
jgi:multicomponent Na+:H+ antiporter subunit D